MMKEPNGQALNQLKTAVNDKVTALKAAQNTSTSDNTMDLTRPGFPVAIVSQHPLTLVKK